MPRDRRLLIVDTVLDMQMIQGLFVSASEYAAQLEGHITPEQTVAWWTADPLVWIEESVTLLGRINPATGGQLGVGTANSPAIVPGDYTLRMRPILDARLQQAGVRLAAYLDWVFAGE